MVNCMDTTPAKQSHITATLSQTNMYDITINHQPAQRRNILTGVAQRRNILTTEMVNCMDTTPAKQSHITATLSQTNMYDITINHQPAQRRNILTGVAQRRNILTTEMVNCMDTTPAKQSHITATLSQTNMYDITINHQPAQRRNILTGVAQRRNILTTEMVNCMDTTPAKQLHITATLSQTNMYDITINHQPAQRRNILTGVAQRRNILTTEMVNCHGGINLNYCPNLNMHLVTKMSKCHLESNQPIRHCETEVSFSDDECKYILPHHYNNFATSPKPLNNKYIDNAKLSKDCYYI